MSLGSLGSITVAKEFDKRPRMWKDTLERGNRGAKRYAFNCQKIKSEILRVFGACPS